VRDELDALKARAETLGREAFLGSVPQRTTPPAAYYLIELANGARPDDLPLSEATSAWDLALRIKSVGLTFEQALTFLADARDLLVPLGRVGQLAVAGRGVTLLFVRHEADYVDRDVSPHKHISLDTFTLSSVPADPDEES
jgi:hypothetical protein